MPQEAADGVVSGEVETEAEGDAALAVSEQLLTWARQVSTAMKNGSKVSSVHAAVPAEQSLSVSQSETARPAQADASAASTEPFAFDMSSFGGSGGASEAPALRSSQAEDTFASDTGAFGGAAANNSDTSVRASADTATAVKPSAASAAAADPFAFDMGAFGLSVAPEEEVSSILRQASNTSSISASQQQSGASADPFAFNMEAFGLSGVTPPHGDNEEASSNQYSADRAETAAQSSAQGPGANPAAGSSADPFAFDMGASCMGDVANAAEPSGSDAFALDRGAAEELPQSAASTGTAAAAVDPFAFDMCAFGIGSIAVSEAEGHCNGNDPFGSDRGASEQHSDDMLASGASLLGSGTLDPASLGMRGGPVGATAHDQTISSSDFATRSAQLAVSTSYSGSEAAGANQVFRQQEQQQKQPSRSAALPAFAPPVRETFTPLSASERRDLQQLLYSAAGLPDPSSDQGGFPCPGTQGRAALVSL